LALEWIATNYRSARTGERRCSDLGEDCKNACGFHFSAHQSDVTVSKYKEDYRTVWNGKKYELRAHIGKGNGRNPESTIRIAFFFDEVSSKAVIGFFGQHQQTDVS